MKLKIVSNVKRYIMSVFNLKEEDAEAAIVAAASGAIVGLCVYGIYKLDLYSHLKSIVERTVMGSNVKSNIQVERTCWDDYVIENGFFFMPVTRQ